MKEVAKDATVPFGGDGKLWSETSVKSRLAVTRISVATFSGASCNALRTSDGLQKTDNMPQKTYCVAGLSGRILLKQSRIERSTESV